MQRFRGLVAGVTVVVLGLVATACDGGDDDEAASTTSRPSTTTSTQVGQPDDPEAARAEITAAFETFLDGTNPREERIAAVQDADELSETFTAAGEAEPPGVTGEVANIAFTGADSATVLFNILVNGTVALPNFPGEAVMVDGEWKVSRTTVCDLLAQSGVTCPA
ncbi:MAG TPA: hypothetical protein VM618_05955 [Acidimicrobiia bacterium]|nr:hypothetical protein [Acidimicrobiia bacterium]